MPKSWPKHSQNILFRDTTKDLFRDTTKDLFREHHERLVPHHDKSAVTSALSAVSDDVHVIDGHMDNIGLKCTLTWTLTKT